MNSQKMDAGSLVAERFEVERFVRTAEPAVIFRARDRCTQKPVALKVVELSQSYPQDAERLLREAQTLAAVEHPRIVRYVAHGQTGQGQVYLATEWLEGERLAERLARQPLRLKETLTLARGVAEALAALHRAGPGRWTLHGDLKPSKLLLREGQVEGVTIVDFDQTISNLSVRTVMGSGEIAGTLRYLAPEQARGERDLSPSVDIFSLGCVLFECLTGAAPFDGGHVAEVLARILYEEAPPLGHLQSGLPQELEDLLGRMLAKRPDERVRDGAALVALLARLRIPPEYEERTPVSLARPPSILQGAEQRLVSVIVALPPVPGQDDHDPLTLQAEVERQLAPYAARVDRLADGSLVGILAHNAGLPVDLAVQAARAALVVRECLAGWSVVLTTGRGVAPEAMLLGQAFQQALELLSARPESGEGPGPRELAPRTPLWLDALTAELLSTRAFFTVRREQGGRFVLEGERTGGDEVRLLLGRPTPCVGREQELRLLVSLLSSCVADGTARVLLVVAPSGFGKSRLRQEFLRRLPESQVPEVEVLLGQGDPLRAGKAYGLLGQAVVELCALHEIAEAQARQAQLAARVGRHLEGVERQRVVEFMGELCGYPLPDDRSPQLRAARQEPRLMSDQVTSAFVSFLRAECQARPVVLVLEDLHWSDAATVRLVDAVLRALEECPLFVLALARPEVKEFFPRLWEERSVQELRLGGLGRKASEHLVREVLGMRASGETVARIVTQAGGHALFLEELIRAAAEGTEDALPETVVAMLQARFLRLDAAVRRLLEAASVYGETFWRGGVRALVGGGAELDRGLAVLVGSEMIVKQTESRFPGEEQYAFRHALVSEAAQGLLTEEDRRLGHRLAGGYLESVGERDAVMLAEHYQRGGELGRAAHFFAQAAKQALAGTDLGGALKCVERGVACGASGEVLGSLRAVEAWAHIWNWNFPAAYAAGLEGAPLLTPGHALWFWAQGAVLTLAGVLGHRDVMAAHLRGFTEATPLPGAESAFIEQLATLIGMSFLQGMTDQGNALLGRMQEICDRLGDNEVRAQGVLQLVLTWINPLRDGDPWTYWTVANTSMSCFRIVGDRRYLGSAQGHAGFAHTLLGAHELALEAFRASIALLEPLQEKLLLGAILGYFAIALVETGDPQHLAEAQAVAERVIANSVAHDYFSGLGRLALSSALAASGELAGAEQVARETFMDMEWFPPGQPFAHAVLSRILLAQGRCEEARATAESGLVPLGTLGGRVLMDVRLHLALAEARDACGDRAGAVRALGEAVRQIERRAAQIPDSALRAQYLSRVTDNARALELHRRWQAHPLD